MKKTRLLFISLSVYTLAAFAWWTFAHIRNTKAMYEEKKNMFELLCYKATVDMNGAIQQEMFRDTLGVTKYFYANYPELEIIITTESAFNFDNYLIRPKKSSYDTIKKEMERKILMYTLEGIVMFSILFWGIIWIYRNFKQRINLRKQQSNFLLSITHELKTPLSSIKLYLETLKKHKLDEEKTDIIIQNSINDVERLHDLVENILLAAQLDNHKYEPHFVELNLSELVSETIDKFASPRNGNHQIIKTIDTNISLVADENSLVMVLNNLLSNAVKYSPEGSVIEILLKSTNEHIVLSVSNEGINISDEDKESLFNKFYRAGDENTRKTKGTGLGLFIVKNLLSLHKADITVKDKHPQGTVFEIIFKKNV